MTIIPSSAHRRLLAGTGLLLALAPAAAMASGFYIVEQSPKATGRAYSGEVADTGPESLWWNPASIAGQTGAAAHIGASAILPSAKLTNVSTLIVRPGQAPAAVGGDQTVTDPINKGVAPTGAISYGFNDKIAIGLAITAPFNFTTDLPATSWARYSATRTSLRTFDIQPSLALQPIPGLRLGVGLNIEHADASLANALPNLSPLLADGSQTLKGKGWDIGVSAGLQFQRGPVTLGASFKSAIKHKLAGSVTIDGLLGPLAGKNASVNTEATFTTPWQAIFGLRFALTPTITLNAQTTATGWSKFDAIRLGAPLNAALPQNYRDTWAYAFGIDAVVSPKWTLRTGVLRDQTPVRNDFRDARVPDSNRWLFGAGATHQLSRKVAIDAGVNYVLLDSAPINRLTAAYAGTAAQTPVLVNGTVSDAHVLILSLGGRFTF
jgi:long-chain fatty acid transport protein